MLSDEEKKAIELLKQPPDFSLSYYKRENAIDTVLNLIEKQQKEIEELKNITKSYDSFLGDEKIVIADKKFFVNGYFQENFVRKDKIKAEIEELKNMKVDGEVFTTAVNFGIKVLQSLLEERN